MGLGLPLSKSFSSSLGALSKTEPKKYLTVPQISLGKLFIGPYERIKTGFWFLLENSGCWLRLSVKELCWIVGGNWLLLRNNLLESQNLLQISMRQKLTTLCFDTL